MSVSDTPTVEVKEAKVFNLPTPPQPPQPIHITPVPNHGQVIPNHGQMVPNHGQMVPNHGQVVPNHGQAVPNHGQMVPNHVTMEVASDDMNELQHFEELEKSIAMAVQDSRHEQTSPDKTSRDSGVSDGSSPSPNQDPVNTVVSGINSGVAGISVSGINTASRNPSDPLPKAPVKAEVSTNEVDAVEDSRKPPPYHIAAQMSRHANGFQVLIAYKSVSAGSLITSLSVKRFTYKLRLFLAF